jgi:anti-sigma factor ChrR (cupin superfamily)
VVTVAETAFFLLPGGTVQPMDLPLSEVMQDQVNAGVLRRVDGPVAKVVQEFEERAGGSITRFVQASGSAVAAVDPDAVPAGTIDEILAWVGNDTDRAGRALDAEQAARSPRKTLVTTLTELVEG